MRNNVCISSMLLYPVRRHLHFDNRLTLTNGIALSAPNEEPLLHLFEEVWVKGHYSIPEFSIGDGDVIVDVGAHVGTFTVWAASRNPKARVVAVEPSASTLKYLRRNVETNHLRNVTIVEAACGGSNGTVALMSRGPAACNTIYRTDNYASSFSPAGRAEMITLDKLFSDLSIEHCDLLKLDCEGAEYEILYSAGKETLDRVRRIAMEYHTGMNRYSPESLAEHLKGIGFKVDLQAPLDEEGGYLLATRD